MAGSQPRRGSNLLIGTPDVSSEADVSKLPVREGIVPAQQSRSSKLSNDAEVGSNASQSNKASGSARPSRLVLGEKRKVSPTVESSDRDADEVKISVSEEPEPKQNVAIYFRREHDSKSKTWGPARKFSETERFESHMDDLEGNDNIPDAVRLGSYVKRKEVKEDSGNAKTAKLNRGLVKELAKCKSTEEVLKCIDRIPEEKFQFVDNIALATMFNRLARHANREGWRARQGVQEKNEYKRVMRLLKSRINQLCQGGYVRPIATIHWALAKIQAKDGVEIFKKCESYIREDMDAFASEERCQHLANLTWAYANLQGFKPKRETLAATERVARSNLDAFKPQELSNMFWAWASLQYKCEIDTVNQSMALILYRTKALVIEKFRTRELIFFLWGIVKAGHALNERFWYKADEMLQRSLEEDFTLDGKKICLMLWVVAAQSMRYKKIYPSPGLLEKLEDAIEERVDQMNQHDVSATLQACFNLKIAPSEAAMQKIEQHLVKNIEFLKKDHNALINCLYGMAQLSRPSKWFQDNIDITLEPIVGDLLSRDVGLLLWVLTVMRSDGEYTKTVKALAKEARTRDVHSFDMQNSLQFLQADKIFGGKVLTDSLRRNFLAQAKKMMGKDTTRESLLQKDISRVLDDMGYCHKMEQQLDDGAISCDLVLKPSANLSQEVILEVDGPTHFVVNRKREKIPNGSTFLRNRLHRLSSRGVVSIPYFEWRKCASVDERREYLERKLAKFLV